MLRNKRAGAWGGWRRWTFAGVSVVVHAALIAALVAATEEEPVVAAEPSREEVTYVDISAFPPPPPPPSAPSQPEPRQQPEQPRQVEPQPQRPTPRPTPRTPARATDIVEPELDSVPEPLGDVPTVQPIAPPRSDGPPAGAVAGAQTGGRPGGQAGGVEGGVEGGRVGGQVGAEPPSGGTFVEAVVDRKAELTNRRQLPRIMERLFPASLRDAGVGGRVVVQFVVDTNGRVDMSSVKVMSSTHDGFVDPTKKALREFKFRPARMGTQNVRMLTQMPIVWQVEGS